METIDRGIVIRSINYGEYDQIITVLFLENGLRSLIAKGINKTHSKNREHIQIGNYSVFFFFKSRSINNLSKLKKASTIKNYNKIKKSTSKYAVMIQCLEIVYKIIQNDLEQLTNDWHHELLIILEILINDNFVALIKLIQFSLNKLGFKINNDFCGKCHSKRNIANINHNYGGLVCYRCYPHISSKKLITDFCIITSSYDKKIYKIKEENKVIILNFFIEWLKINMVLSTKSINFIKLIDNK